MTPLLLIDDPMPGVVRLTLNRPEKKNALNNSLRGALFREFRRADASRETAVVIIRGAGDCFSAGYDLGEKREPSEREATVSEGWWSRLAITNWFEMWDRSTATASLERRSWRRHATWPTCPTMHRSAIRRSGGSVHRPRPGSRGSWDLVMAWRPS